MYEFDLVLLLLQQMCVYLVIAWALSKTPLIIPLLKVTIRLPHKVMCYFIFSIFCIMGTYFGLHINDSIANTRAIGSVLGGLLGGPGVGFLVGFTGGLHRYSLGGMTAFSCMVSTIAEGLIGGLIHSYYMKRGKINKLFNPWTAAGVTLFAEIIQMLIILLLAKPFNEALALVKNIAAPMVIANSIGAAMFIRILLDRRAIVDRYTSAFSAQAMKIAVCTEGILRKGFNADNSMKVAKIIYQQLEIGAVAITDREKLLAFIGIGADHHIPGTPIASIQSRRAIDFNEVVYADGNETPYKCSLDPTCKLGSALVIPLRGENQRVIGTIKLYEGKNRLFSSINRTLGEGIASLFSAQILAGQYERNKQSLLQSEVKLLHAQVNPHFLFNVLNTLQAVIRRDSQQAGQLVQYISTFFRKNLKRPENNATLGEEIEHVNAYLQIEKARFRDNLQVHFEIPDQLNLVELPAFSLQPMVENAIKHGTSQLLGIGRITIRAYQYNQCVCIEIEDNAGLYQPSPLSDGLGMSLVDKRLRLKYGEKYGVSVEYEPEEFTRIKLNLPYYSHNLIK
ncbi:sensor histidine kinase [Moellerella wisconsensis]|uniref:Autolysin sensor kinase n=2 Tax=Moellerella wisconsensis TaxID=158849 RepID=A0A0N0Z9G9_9GAMM|nr:sensor histidine kinase [Moellerella wisconsensis]KPD04219.1 autolysin sensor kinase [Moellerella wisconsensis ATCC 35017]UNH23948.1 sensor histidine kinase [Moellerella wisconsensis]UNH38664.1 sensor histidine kinase [Moellerella wisconsensis]VFS52239.1 Probable sensor-like histidine kinase YehU [Moellerella wisconsensis]